MDGFVAQPAVQQRLIPLAETEEKKAQTHSFKAILLRMLRKHTPDGSTVRQAVNKSRLNERWEAAENDVYGKAR